jgi:hypothetical protein
MKKQTVKSKWIAGAIVMPVVIMSTPGRVGGEEIGLIDFDRVRQ